MKKMNEEIENLIKEYFENKGYFVRMCYFKNVDLSKIKYDNIVELVLSVSKDIKYKK